MQSGKREAINTCTGFDAMFGGSRLAEQYCDKPRPVRGPSAIGTDRYFPSPGNISTNQHAQFSFADCRYRVTNTAEIYGIKLTPTRILLGIIPNQFSRVILMMFLVE